MVSTSPVATEKGTSIEQRETRTESIQDVALTKEWIHTDGRQGADQEHKMTLWRGIKAYPGAITWSVLLSTAIIMEGEQKIGIDRTSR